MTEDTTDELTKKVEIALKPVLQAEEALGLSGIQVEGRHVMVVLETDPALGAEMETRRQEAENAVKTLEGVEKVTAVLTARRENKSGGSKPARPARIENLAPDVKFIIAVASGKGGVGKSTVAVNLAVALAQQGLKTGLLDADIYGPSAPAMLGITEKPHVENNKLDPLEAHGIKVMSMGFLVESDSPMIWRGPMIQTALRQFLQDVRWGDLDVMVVDMPPGTGDAQLTMAQKVPLSGAVIVSTPQDIALLDARKGMNMFSQVGVPVLGIIENMSTFICPECGHEEHIFGHGGAKAEAEKLDCPYLGEIPLRAAVRYAGDEGLPVALAQSRDDETGERFRQIAQDIMAGLRAKS